MPPLLPSRPDPTAMRGSWLVTGDLAPGTSIPTTEIREVMIPTAGASRIRIRAQTDTAAALDLVFVQPPGNGQNQPAIEYPTNQPTQVALAAGVENVLEIDPHFGEGQAILRITAGAGTVVIDHVTVSQV